MPFYEIAQLYVIAERALVYEYCISDGQESLLEQTRKMMPLLFGSVRVCPGK